MQTALYLKFIEASSGTNLPSEHVIFKLNGLINNINYKHICVVEGRTDKMFYEGFLFKSIGVERNDIEYIYGQGELGGKSNVIDAYKHTKEYYNGMLKKLIFIVDKDYDGINRSKYKLEKNDLNYITVLPCYSFENYYLDEINLQKLFKYLLDDNYSTKLDIFLDSYYRFIEAIYKYCNIKRIIVMDDIKGIKALTVNGKDSLEKLIEIQGYNINSKLNDILKQAEGELYIIDKSKYEQYIKTIELLKENPSFIKGKILFNYLNNYLSENMGLPIYKEQLYNLSEKLVIEIGIKLDTNK